MARSRSLELEINKLNSTLFAIFQVNFPSEATLIFFTSLPKGSREVVNLRAVNICKNRFENP